MSDSFGIILGMVAGGLLLGAMSMDSRKGSKKTIPYKTPERTNPLTENNFSFKPEDDELKKSPRSKSVKSRK